MEPLNYDIQPPNAFNDAVKGYQAGLAINQAQQAQHLQQLQIQQSQQMQKDLNDLSNNPNASAKDYSSMITRYPQLANQLKSGWDMINADKQQSSLGNMSQVYAALQSGNIDAAKSVLQDQATAAENSGDIKESNAAKAMMRIVDMNPDYAKTSSALMLATALGPDKFASTFSTISKLPSEVAKGEAEAAQKGYESANTPQRLDLENTQTAANIKNIYSQINDRAGRLGLDKDKLQSDVEMKLYELNQKLDPSLNLGPDAKKLINDSAISSTSSAQTSDQMRRLASDLEAQGGGYGAFSTENEWLKKQMGNQTAMTNLRQEYTRIRSSQVSKMLPPGSASDRDVALAMQGFPPDTADAQTMATFLRGMAKLNNYSAISDNAKAEWVNAVGHLGKPRTDINIDGVTVPAGTPFADFAKQYIDRKVNQVGIQQGQQDIRNRNYMKYATPGAR
jgi:hypothetical protein